jgi:hypothetical protein
LTKTLPFFLGPQNLKTPKGIPKKAVLPFYQKNTVFDQPEPLKNNLPLTLLR